jgi:hypothetical protein
VPFRELGGLCHAKTWNQEERNTHEGQFLYVWQLATCNKIRLICDYLLLLADITAQQLMCAVLKSFREFCASYAELSDCLLLTGYHLSCTSTAEPPFSSQ